MFASSRCSPQVASGDASGTGVPSFDLSSRKEAPPSVEQRPLNAEVDSIQGVETFGYSRCSSWMPAAMSVPGANGFDGTIESKSIGALALSEAGLVHTTCWPAFFVRP